MPPANLSESWRNRKRRGAKRLRPQPGSTPTRASGDRRRLRGQHPPPHQRQRRRRRRQVRLRRHRRAHQALPRRMRRRRRLRQPRSRTNRTGRNAFKRLATHWHARRSSPRRCRAASTSSRPTSSPATIRHSGRSSRPIGRRRSPSSIVVKKEIAQHTKAHRRHPGRSAPRRRPARLGAVIARLSRSSSSKTRTRCATMLRHALEAQGHAVLEARDEAEAIQQLRQIAPGRRPHRL